jgi:hypothetical protein
VHTSLKRSPADGGQEEFSTEKVPELEEVPTPQPDGGQKEFNTEKVPELEEVPSQMEVKKSLVPV